MPIPEEKKPFEVDRPLSLGPRSFSSLKYDRDKAAKQELSQIGISHTSVVGIQTQLSEMINAINAIPKADASFHFISIHSYSFQRLFIYSLSYSLLYVFDSA